jgi:hypothetical protein
MTRVEAVPESSAEARTSVPELVIPPGWARTAAPDHGIIVAARSPATGLSGYAPTLVLDAEPVDVDLGRWQLGTAEELAAALEYFEIEESDLFDLFGEPVGYRMYSFFRNGQDLLTEQWCWLVDGVGYTMSGTAARVDYLDVTDLFEQVAESFRVPPVARGQRSA